VRAKLAAKHPPVSEADVREAFVLTSLRRSFMDDDPERGRRLIVTGITYDGRLLSGVLYPADETDGTWWLATALYGTL